LDLPLIISFIHLQKNLPVPGYYCPGGSDNPTDIVCPAGHFCVQATESPEQCSSGYFSNATGLTSDAGCQECPGGYYCPNAGRTCLD